MKHTSIKILYCSVLSKVPLWTSSDPISDSHLSSKHWFCWKDLFRCSQIATKSEWWVKGGHSIVWFSSIKLELEYHILSNTKAAAYLCIGCLETIPQHCNCTDFYSAAHVRTQPWWPTHGRHSKYPHCLCSTCPTFFIPLTSHVWG